MSYLWNAYKTNKAGVCVCMCVCVCVCVCARLNLNYICPFCISTYKVDMKHPLESVLVFGVAPPTPPSPPPAVAARLFSPVDGSLLSAHETDGFRLMGVFVALRQWRLWLVGLEHTADPHLRGGGGRHLQLSSLFYLKLWSISKEMQLKAALSSGRAEANKSQGRDTLTYIYLKKKKRRGFLTTCPAAGGSLPFISVS